MDSEGVTNFEEHLRISIVTDSVTDANNTVIVPPENSLRDNTSQLGHTNKRQQFHRDSHSAIGPVYVRGTEVWQSRLDAASSYTPSFSTEEGERFMETLSKKVHSNFANQGQLIMIPADNRNENEVLDADWGATANFVFALLQEKPTSEISRVTIVGYLHTPAVVELQAKLNIAFKTPNSSLAPLGINDEAIKTMMSQLVSVDVLVEVPEMSKSETIDKMAPLLESNYIVKVVSLYGIKDSDNCPRECSLKNEGVKRMVKVAGMIRLMGMDRFERLIVDLYYCRRTFNETIQRYVAASATLPDDSIFKTFVKLPKLVGLPIVDNADKLEKLLLGDYPLYDRTGITLSDFIRYKKETYSWGHTPTREGRTLLEEAFTNLRKVMVIFHGYKYSTCCE